MGLRILETSRPLNDPSVRELRDKLRGGALTGGETGPADVRALVREVLADVRARGDAAVLDLTEKIEKVRLTPQHMRVSAEELAAARHEADPAFLELIEQAAANVREYQESIRVTAPPALRRGGRKLGVRYTPIDRVGIFIPGGGGTGAVLVSSLLMTAVPAQVAGVREIALVSPPTVKGDVSPALLAAASAVGVQEVYRVSGTAGLAALAYGTETIPAVDQIVGPGSAFIAEAKRQLFGRVGIDSIAGPSEVLIIADDTAPPAWVAADLLAQAEHAPGSAVLVTPSRKLADAVAAEVETQLGALTRADAARQCLDEYSAVVVVPDLGAACEVANNFATEHLQIMTADDDAVLAKIRHAGAIFVGRYSPVPLGDYYAGPSHVLPTGGTARFFSALSCNDFLKASSVIRYDASAAAEDADAVADFAEREGLTAHAAAVRMRKEKPAKMNTDERR